jgi:manganese efflux pump family protein
LVFGLVLVAVALGLSNFAGAIAIGLAGVDASMRWRVAVIFGLFEGAMPVVGLVLGQRVAGSLGASSSGVGGGLLIATGMYTIWQARYSRSDPIRGRGIGSRAQSKVGLRVFVATGAALSIDNLVVGFALGTYKVPLALAAIVIAVVSVAMSLAGLELGARLGKSIEGWSEEIGGAVLITVGAAIAAGIL